MLKQRNIAVCIILTFITCGLYGIYWFVTLVDDVNRAANENDTSGVAVFLLSLITCGIYSLYWMYRMGRKINAAWQRKGRNSDPNLGFLYIILSILSAGIIAYALIQNEINQLATAE